MKSLTLKSHEKKLEVATIWHQQFHSNDNMITAFALPVDGTNHFIQPKNKTKIMYVYHVE